MHAFMHPYKPLNFKVEVYTSQPAKIQGSKKVCS